MKFSTHFYLSYSLHDPRTLIGKRDQLYSSTMLFGFSLVKHGGGNNGFGTINCFCTNDYQQQCSS